MKHAGTAFLVVTLFSTLGFWGIAQQKNGTYASRLRDLEARYAKIEEEQHTFAQQREKSQRRIAALEGEKAELTQAIDELKAAAVERDDLRIQLTARTKERDGVAQDLKAFSRELQSLLGRVDAAVANSSRPATTEAIPASRRSD